MHVVRAFRSARAPGDAESPELPEVPAMSTTSRLNRVCFPSVCTCAGVFWTILAVAVVAVVFGMGTYEAKVLSTHVLRSPCTIVDEKVHDVGTCRRCASDGVCKEESYSAAKVTVTFAPTQARKNVTADVWFCKKRLGTNPCSTLEVDTGDMDQYFADRFAVTWDDPDVCTTKSVEHEVARYRNSEYCYYSEQSAGYDVWFKFAPSETVAQIALAQKHPTYWALLQAGFFVPAALLLACVGLEGVELLTSGTMERDDGPRFP